MDLFYPQTKLGPTIPTLWGTLFTYTMCHRYLSGLITTAHNCLLKQNNTSVPELLPSAGMPHSGLPALFCGSNRPSSPGHSIGSFQVVGLMPVPWTTVQRTRHASKDGHKIQGTLPDQGSGERWVYDPSLANQLA